MYGLGADAHAYQKSRHATLAKYAIVVDEASDLCKGRGRQALPRAIKILLAETAQCLEQMLTLLDAVPEQIQKLEERILARVEETPTIQRLKSLSGVGSILALVIERKIGTIQRFAGPDWLASSSGTTPRVHAHGGKV